MPARFALFGHHVGEDAAAHVEFCGEAHEARLEGGDQVVQDAVGDSFVEMPLVAERPDIQLEAFQFDALLVRDVIQHQCGKVGLAGFGAQAGKFWDLHMDMVVPQRARVGEGFQGFGGLRGHVGMVVRFG